MAMARIVSRWVAMNWNAGKRPAACPEPVERQERVAEISEGDLGAALVGGSVGHSPEVVALPGHGFHLAGSVEDSCRILRRRDDGLQPDEEGVGVADLSCLGDGDVDDLAGELASAVDRQRSPE